MGWIGNSGRFGLLDIANGRAKMAIVMVLIMLSGGFIAMVPDMAGAETRPGGTLKNDQPARVYTTGWWWTTIPDDLTFKVPSRDNYYTAVAILNRNTGEDFDLFAYSDYDMEDLISQSTEGSDKVDFVVIDGHTYSGSNKYVKVTKFTGQDWTSGIRIESDYHCYKGDLYGSDPDANGTLSVGSYRYSMFENHGTSTYTGTLRGDLPLVNMYDVYLDAGGQYNFQITSVPSAERLSMYLFKGSGTASDSLVSTSGTAGSSLSLSYDPEASGYYGLCIIDQNSGSSSTDNYTMLVKSNFRMSSSPVSRLIAPGMSASYQIDVTSLGVTKDIDLHYRWRTSTSNTTTPAGAWASLSKSKVNAGGVGTQKVYLNVTTTSSMAAGTYYLQVYGNDTGAEGAKKSTGVVLTVSTSPDYFLSVDPSLRIISPDSSTTYTVDMDTINTYTGKVDLSASADKSNSMFTFTFVPTNLTSSSDKSTLTVKASSSTPIGLYNITVRGNDGTLVRTAMTQLRIKKPVDIDVIAPTASELVSGAFTFKVSAGTPSETKSVKVSFGGNMLGAGTLNMYYNSGSQFWERSLNTYSYLDGTCTMNITVEDHASGFTTEGPVYFILSNSAPNPIIKNPMDRSYVTGRTMPITVETTSYVVSVRFRVDSNAWIPMTRSGNTWIGSYDTTIITDGPHELSVDAKDSAGKEGTNSVTIYVDNNKPTCNINSPIEGQYIEGSYTFRVIATDTVAVNNVDITVFGSTLTIPYNPITSSYEYTVTTSTRPDGKYSVRATAFDKVNLTQSSPTIDFYVDNNAPSLSILSPDDNEILGGLYTISVDSADSHLNSVKYRIDSTGWKNLTGKQPSFNEIINTTSLTDGAHTLSVRSMDNLSHMTEQVIEFVVDNTAPTCSLVSPFDGAYLESVHIFKVSASDVVGIDRVVLNMFSDSVQTTINKQSGYYEYSMNTLTVADRQYTVTAGCYDLSGKLTSSSVVTFRVDNNPPEMAIHGLQNGNYVQGRIDLNVTVSDAFLMDVRYSIDGGGWSPINTTWDTALLLDGTHTVAIMARDLAGHSTRQNLDLIVDNNVPVCSVNGPVNDEFIEGAYRFRLSAYDAVGIDRVQVHVFGNDFSAIFSSASGYFEFNTDTSIQPDGDYSCYAITYDRSGKMSVSQNVSFHIDNNAPVLRIDYPIDGSYLEGVESMDVNVSDRFLDRVEYDVDGSGWVPIDTLLNTTIFGDGYHLIRFRAVDRIAHTTSTSSDVIIDNTDPYGAVSDPVSDQYIEGIVTFRSVASDAVGIDTVVISVFGSTLDMKYNIANGYFEYTTDTRLIPDGAYILDLTVTDLSGKVTTVGPHPFNLDNHAPDLVVLDIIDGDILQGTFVLNFNATDVFLDAVEYQVDSRGWTNASDPLDTTLLNDGAHTIKVRALDLSGKESSLQFSVLFDNLVPTCIINSPVSGEFVQGTITIKVSAFDIVGIDYVTIKVYNFEARVPYNSVTGYYEYSSNTITWGAGEDGVRNVTAIAYDRTGKTSYFGPISFNVDNRAPTVNIISPKAGDVISGLFFFNVINADVFKKGTDYNIDGASWQPVSIGWNTLQVSDGLHRVHIRATDLAGHSTIETIDVLIDNNAPEISMITPSDGEYIEGTYVFRISTSDAVGVQKVILFIAEGERPLSINTQTGYYELMLDTRLLPDGSYKTYASVTDVAHNVVKTEEYTFKVDNRDPTLIIESPVKSQLISGIFAVKARTIDAFPGPVEYSIDGTTIFDVDVPWNSSKVTDGDHVVTVMTTDRSGRSTVFTIDVTVDNGKPVISQSTIVPGEILTGTATLRFYAYDSIGIRQVTLSMDKASAFEIYRGEGGLYYEYDLNTRILSDGDHSIKVAAMDRAGNSISAVYAIKVDNSGPTIEVDYYWIEKNTEVRIGDVAEGKSVIFVAIVKDPSGIGTVMINIDSSGWMEMTPDSNGSRTDTYVLYWPSEGGGAHVFQVRTSDKLGNENTLSGILNVKEVKPKESLVDRFISALPIIWFLLIVIVLIVVGVLAYTGVLAKWMRGEGMKRTEEPPRKEKGLNPRKKAIDADTWEPVNEK
jgi:hypothetical protein